MWTVKALTIFPEMFPGPLGGSLAGKALKEACGRWRRSISGGSPRIVMARWTMHRSAAVQAW
jgi:hypothetical protein